MKKIIILFLLICSISVKATVYQIANQAAFDAFNQGSLVAGDQFQLAKGQTFHGSISLSVSGTAGNPIVITSYGSGAAPILTGFVTVVSWTNTGSNIWESTSAVSSLSSLNMVTVNGVNTAMGRYPNETAANSGYLNFESHSSNTSITDTQLTDAINWTGAEVVVRPVRWIFDRRTIAGHTGGTLTFSALSYTPLDGFGYFIQNDARTLDLAGEWFYNTSTKKLKIYSTSQPTSVKVPDINDLMTINASYITVNGIQFEGANDNAITGDGTLRSNIIIQNCTFRFCGGTIISNINADNFTITANTFSDSNNNGLSGGTGDNITITNNTISNIGLLRGMGSLIYSAISVAENSGVLISGNTISNIGNNGISFYGDNTRVKNNLIDGFCSRLDDGGGIYTYTGNRTAMSNDTVKYNIVINGTGAIDGTSGNQTSTAIGIYMDNNSKNVEIAYNTVGNINTYGILMNSPSYINIHHNTIYNCSPALRSTAYTGQNLVNNNLITNNTFFAYQTTQNMITLVSQDEVLFDFGIINNNIYSRPLLISGAMFTTTQPSAQYVTRTFAQWQSYMSQDANSTLNQTSVSSSSDIQFMYNETATPKNVALNWPAVDMTGVKKVGIITLAPYTSGVYLKDSSPAPQPSGTVKRPGRSGNKFGMSGNRPGLI